jgi:Helix-turn-helix domain
VNSIPNQTPKAIPEKFLSALEAANYLGLKPQTLATLRWAGRGPKFYRIGSRAIRYTLHDLNDYAGLCQVAEVSQ